MEAFDSNGDLRSDSFEPEALDVIIGATQHAAVAETRSLNCKPGHMLLALWKTLSQSEDYNNAIYAGLAEGFTVTDIPSILETYLHDTDHEQTFSGKRDEFHPCVVRALETCDRLENELGDTAWEARGPLGIVPLWTAILSNPSAEDREYLGPALDFNRSAAAFAALLTAASKPAAAIDLFSPDSLLKLDQFDDIGVAVLDAAREKAGRLGYDKIRPVHLFLALLARPDSLTEEAIRLHAKPGAGPAKVAEVIDRAISLGPGVSEKQLDLNRYSLSDRMRELLEAAAAAAAKNDSATIGERFLLKAVLEDTEGVVSRALADPEIAINSAQVLKLVVNRIRDFKLGKVREEAAPFHFPRNLAKSEDLTYLAHIGQIRASVGQSKLIAKALQGLHKRENNHVLITGQPGVGKTELVRELARRITAGEIDFLKRKKLLYIDCEGIAPVESREKLQAIITTVKGRNDILLCLDHFEHVVRYAGTGESHNRATIKVALRNRDITLIGIVRDEDFGELLSNDHGLLEMMNRVRVEEVKLDEAIEIVREAFVPELEHLYALRIEPAAVKRAAVASREFMMSERLPVKAIKMLRDACEQVSFDKEMRRDRAWVVTDYDVVRAVAQRTGIDEETIAGKGANTDFRKVLDESVVGQPEAVRTVAEQLERMKAGATKQDKPAGVFLFAGLTGTGKTELAKAIAKVYSAGGSMSVYPMMNFKESHSISGIVGVPPGYVGYEQGGRLINDLNADPYKVVLFDEAEKAHPDIWQGMLSLFDEAWIEDRRNIRAYGNRAIFILTSNAGAAAITEMLKKGCPMDEIKEAVGTLLIEFKNKEGHNVFSPEFLARFTDIVIFNPLSLAAMEAITTIHFRRTIKEWYDKRNKRLTADEEVLKHVAKLAYNENESHGGTRGGRVALKLLANLAEKPALDLMVKDPAAFENAEVVRVMLEPGPKIVARIEKSVSVSPDDALKRAVKQMSEAPNVDGESVLRPIREQFGSSIGGWKSASAGGLPTAAIEAVESAVAGALLAVKEKVDEINQVVSGERNKLIEALQDAACVVDTTAT